PGFPSAMTSAQLVENSLLPPSDPKRVNTDTLVTFLAIIEQRVQQLCAEFEAIRAAVRARAAGSDAVTPAVPRGPRVEHDEGRHAFHIDVRRARRRVMPPGRQTRMRAAAAVCAAACRVPAPRHIRLRCRGRALTLPCPCACSLRSWKTLWTR